MQYQYVDAILRKIESMMGSWWKLILVLLVGAAATAGFVFKDELLGRSVAIMGGELVELVDGRRSVRISGAKLVPVSEYSLSAPYAAKVDSILVDEGDVVGAAGSGVLKLDTAELELELKKYESMLARERAIVEKLRQGTRYEELMIVQQQKKSAESSKKTIGQSAVQALYSAFVQADDAIRKQTNPMFSDPEGSDPQLSFAVADADLEAEIEKDREALSGRLRDWKDLVSDIKASDDLEKRFEKTESNLRAVREYLDEVALAVNSLSAGAVSQSTIDAWKAATLVARSDVEAAAAAMSESRLGYAAAKQGTLVATRELDLRIAGTDKQDIEVALDAADAARTQMEIIAERLKQATISTPENNLLVKKIIPEKGEFMTAGLPVAIVASPDMEIEADIAEEDLRGIEIGGEVLLRLTAFPDQDVRGKISEIEGQEIEREGSVYFRIHAAIDTATLGSKLKLRSGMTGDLVVATRETGKIILVPKRLVSYRDGRSFVRVVSLDTGLIREKMIETGMAQGEDVEVLSGVSVGEQMVRE